MRLLSLELHGFKSFPERTKINFDSGMTVIVGPNGSGKSNISDAVKWVLGELSAKNIRGVKLEDVIFGGTDKRSPMGFAEVSLTIDNSGANRIASDYNEITVTRRYFRTGESEYLINGAPSRLKDIVELFMNTGIGKTGYSVIGQGKISEIIAQKSEDRRYVFEEAAGISKYRYKKQEAERKLAETENNLVRITDIVSVLGARIEPLSKESEKARLYLDLYEKKKALDVSLAVFDISDIARRFEEFERNYNMSKHALEMCDDSINSLEKQSEELYQKSEENKSLLREAQETLSEKTGQMHELRTAGLLAQKEAEHNESEIERLSSELESIEKLERNYLENKEILKEKLKKDTSLKNRLFSEYTDIDAEHAQILHALSDLKKEQEQYESEKKNCENKVIENRIRLSGLTSSRKLVAEKINDIRSEINDINSEVENDRRRIAECEEKLKAYKNEASETQARKEVLIKGIEELKADIAALNENAGKAKVAALSKREQSVALTRMEEHFEGYQRSVRFVLDVAASGKLAGICGPVSKLIRVKREYILAIETSLGAALQNIITEDETAAKNAIAVLKRENAGRATFCPITSSRPSKPSLTPDKASSFKGYVGMANELAECDGKYSGVISSLLGRTFVFDNLDNASALAKFSGYTVRIVTLDGQIINAGGSYTGGSAKKESGILSRSGEIDDLINEAERLNREAAELEKRSAEKADRLNELSGKLDALNDGYLLLAAMYKTEENKKKDIEDKLTLDLNTADSLRNSEEHIKNQDDSEMKLVETLTKDNEKLGSDIASLEQTISSLSEESRKTELSMTSLGEARSKKMLEITVAEKQEEATKLSLDNMLADYDSLAKRKSDVNNETELKKAALVSNRENVQTLAVQLDKLNEAIKQAELAVSQLEDRREQLDKNAQALRERTKLKTDERNVCFEEYTKLENRRSSLLGEKDKLTERLWEDYELTYTAACGMGYPEINEKTRSKSVTEQNRLRAKIRELGNVNVGAIEEYTQVKKEYDDMTAQIDDLNDSRERYTQIVTDLERDMCTKFKESFNLINENFKVVFKELFGGGSAKLELTDPENVLSTGVEIIVSPPGKVIKNLSSLSGGEQVFVAIAILFAIFKINPPPFCLLDEIESALDEVNVSRFANYAKNFSEMTQFIVISHRRGTMEAADSLYGVTMQERGVSKLLSVKVSEVEEKIGLKSQSK